MGKGRPRKASDEAVYAAATRAMARRLPTELTLADIAEEAGVTAGALVQRFGSKRALLARLMDRFSRSAPAMFAALRERAASPLGALYEYADAMACLAPDPDTLARNLAWLHHDLADPEFRGRLSAHARASRREIRRLIETAIEAGELSPDVESTALAEAVEAMVSGSLMSAAVHGGSATSIVRRALAMLLAPWLASASKVRPKRARSPRARGPRGSP
jgi:AcrR family transcriptional regulator